MLPGGLQDSEGPAEALSHESVRLGGSFGEGKRAVLVFDLVAVLQQCHREVGILGHGIHVVAASDTHGSSTPCSDCAGNHADRRECVQSAALEVLAGDVFQRLPARPQVHHVADLGVSGQRANPFVCKMRYQVTDGIVRDDGIGVDANEYFFRDVLQCEI